MRVSTNLREVPVQSGASAHIPVAVFNNDAVIDGISARVIGLPDEFVRVQPPLLSLFPDAGGALDIALALPPNFAAGRHPVTIEIVSHGAHAPNQYLDVDLLVAPKPRLRVASRPRIARGRRTGRFVLDVVNTGNLRLQADLDAVDVDRAMQLRFSEQSVVLEPGARTAVMLGVRGPRMITGAELDRAVSVRVSGQRLDLPPDTIDDTPSDGIGDSTALTFRQRPVIPRGVLTALILVSIVGMWAGAFLLGIAKVFSDEPLTKQAPASFFALTKLAKTGTVSTGFDTIAAPLGALPKDGQLPAGEGSQISGSVIAASDQQPVGRILVEAVRLSHGVPTVVSSAGTQADGTYTLAGLFPTSYYLKFSSEGFRTVWYPNSPTMQGGTPVDAQPLASTSVKTVTVAGSPASISGSVDPGDTTTPVVTTVTARPLVGASLNAPAARTTTDASGRYTLRNLPAPGSYEITFTTNGYESSAIVDSVTGGEQRLEAAIVLSAGQGQISGVVRDSNGPVGGATVSTVVNGSTVTVVTPTSGRVGFYTLEHLPTPATYVVNYTAPGHGTVARIVDLPAGAGAVKSNFDTTLVQGTGSITGQVIDTSGKGLGNVTITVGGVSTATTVTAPATKTLSGGLSKGTFAVNGLTAPGSYTLTAQLDGYHAATVPFTLQGDRPAHRITIQLTRGGGTLEGTVSGPCPVKYCAGATVTATDGTHVYTTTASAPSADLRSGGYLFTGLPAGTYSVTVTQDGMLQQTAYVTVREEQIKKQPLRLG